ncbi:MAG: sugar-binding transcriptional regulator [Actinomycetaceae bacterium]|nr:sugar-binding transcriptional regulator [Actinomycetaceae bacterium]
MSTTNQAAQSPSLAAVVSTDQLRLITRTARLYHERGLKQQEIAAKLSVSQARVSRMLKQAVELGLVKTVVTVPAEVFPEVEEKLEQHYALDQVVVVESHADYNIVLDRMGAATARFLESALAKDDVVGISSWSESILLAARALRPSASLDCRSIVQMVGGVGNTEVQMAATEIMQLLAHRLRAEPVFMLTPAVLDSKHAREALSADSMIRRVTKLWNQLSIAIFGVGGLAPSRLLAQSWNFYQPGDRDTLQKAGAVGDVCVRYFDADGQPVRNGFDERVMSIEREQLLRVPRRVAVAGGPDKYEAIRACLRGGWATTLITDSDTATRLADEI